MTRRDRVETGIIILGSLILGAIIAAMLLHCAPVQVGPFVPPGARLCDSDSDCPDKTHCAFPAPGWKARCMPGDDGLTTPPDEMRRADGGP